MTSCSETVGTILAGLLYVAKRLTFDPGRGGYWAVKELPPLSLRGSVECVRVHTANTATVYTRKQALGRAWGACGYRYTGIHVYTAIS